MRPRLSAIPARHCGTWVVVAMLAIAWGAPLASEREYLLRQAKPGRGGNMLT